MPFVLRSSRAGPGRLLLAAALGLLAGIFTGPPPALGAGAEEGKVYLPVPPEPEYFRLRHLMAEGIMPNYKALWFGFRHQDLTNMKLSLRYIASLSQESERYSLPEKAGSVEDFRRRMGELRRKVEALAADVTPSLDRSAANDRILSIYQSCQSCHDIYAPAERKDARKYTPLR